ncbi:hypothetical protein ACWX0K_00315 [Nitrobacteraceae bacterium UC4446_H13]
MRPAYLSLLEIVSSRNRMAVSSADKVPTTDRAPHASETNVASEAEVTAILTTMFDNLSGVHSRIFRETDTFAGRPTPSGSSFSVRPSFWGASFVLGIRRLSLAARKPHARHSHLHSDQNHAGDEHPGIRQPCEIFRLLLQAQQSEMIEHNRGASS